MKVLGVGDSGAQVLQHVFKERLRNVECIAINTHAQNLLGIPELVVGPNIAHGLGSGGNPEIGRQAAEESRAEIEQILFNTYLTFVVGGLGGGTASGAVPVIAEIATQVGARSMVIVSLPLTFEGSRRGMSAWSALALLEKHSDFVVVRNDDLINFVDHQHNIQLIFSLVARMLAWQVLSRLALFGK